MTKDKALRLAEEAIMDELQAVTDEEFEDAAGKLDDALRAIWKALKEPTVKENLIVEPEVFCGWCKCLPCVCNLLELPTANAALVDTVDISEECVDETRECGHEPVAWVSAKESFCGFPKLVFSETRKDGYKPLYAAPVEPVKREPVAYIQRDQLQKALISTGLCEVSTEPRKDRIGIYTAPQPRHDVDLTDEEIVQIYEENGRRYFCDLLGIGFARAVLTKYKDKQNGN